MKRPVVIVVLALILGELLAVAGVHILVFSIFVPIFLVHRIITKKWRLFLVVIFLFCFIGYCVTEKELDIFTYVTSLSEENVTVVGNYKKSAKTTYGYQYTMESVQIYFSVQGKSKVIPLGQILVSTAEKHDFKVGNQISVQGKLQLFDSARNEGNFDARQYYKSLGIYANVKEESVSVGNQKYDWFQNRMQELRESFRNIFGTLCNDKNQGIFTICDAEKRGIFQAVVIGDKSELTEEVKDLYQINGVAHLLAISGLHISTIGIFIYTLLRRRFRFVVSGSISLFVVLGFVWMSGEGISSVRACGMFLFYLFSQMAGRKYDMLNAISFVTIAVCLKNPLILQNSAFQMSFGSIYAIVFLYPVLCEFLKIPKKKKVTWKKIRKKKYVKQKIQCVFGNLYSVVTHSLVLSVSINMLLIPVLAWNYYEIARYSCVLNIVVIPLMSLVLIPAIAAALCGLFFACGLSMGNGVIVAKVVLLPGCMVLEFYQRICDLFSHLPGNVRVTGKPSAVSILVYYVVLLLGVLLIRKVNQSVAERKKQEEQAIPRTGRMMEVQRKTSIFVVVCRTCFRIGSVVIFTWFLLFFACYHDDGTFQMMFCDVGQGDGIVLRKDTFVVMVDGGSTDVKSVGKYRLETTMKANGIDCVDYAVITHADEDHISGVLEFLKDEMPDKIQIKNLLLPMAMIPDETYEALVIAAEKNGTRVQYIKKGDSIRRGKLEIVCLHPFAGFRADDRNSYSTVLDIKYGKFRMLLTGDISTGEERNFMDLLKKGGEEESSINPCVSEENGEEDYTILKVAHHGSKYSTTSAFLEKVRPAYSVISCGMNNRYGHPHEELLQRLEQIHTEVLRTDLLGQIVFRTDGTRLWVKGSVGVEETTENAVETLGN